MSAVETHSAATGLSRSAPQHVHETYALLLRELTRKQGMVDDLNQIAEQHFGLSPEDCSLLTHSVRDRNALRDAISGLHTLFSD